VRLVDGALPAMSPVLRLAILGAVGGTVYGLWLFGFARERLVELVDLVRRKG